MDDEDGGFTFEVYDAAGKFLLALREADFRHPEDDPAGTARDTAALIAAAPELAEVLRRLIKDGWARGHGEACMKGRLETDPCVCLLGEAKVALEKAGVKL